jgi:hypothetical protein
MLSILQSLSATAAPAAAPGGQEAPAESSAPPPVPEGSAEVACTGVQYIYESLQGITCQEATAIRQVVTDTGEPIGARGQRPSEYHCFWSSAGERDAGLADVFCRHRADGTDLFEANYR